MTGKTSLAVIATSLILAGASAAQTPGTPGASPSPGTRGPVTPQTPGATTPNPPGATTPGLPGNPTTPGLPGVSDPSTTNPTFPCPPGQARRPGGTACIPGPATR
jgi:hypothetical protein